MKVKTEFAEKPHIYNDFLEIMKNFKAQRYQQLHYNYQHHHTYLTIIIFTSINTPGVIERVKNLFRGYNRLILGFNTFLPEGCKIELTAEEEMMLPHDHVPPTGDVVGVASTPGNTTNVMPQSTAKPPPQLQQQHAISYVTTIRNRFANEPETYRSFLKILHTYQEHKGIKDVLEQVSSLFADHPDLLMEFTYFLPDAVQEQAKERLHRAVREAEVRRRMQLAQMQGHGAGKRARENKQPGVANDDKLKLNINGQPRKQARRRKDEQEESVGRPVVAAPRKEVDRSAGYIDRHLSITAERRFFDQVKDVLTGVSIKSWEEFVKALDLFSSDAISKKDLISLVKDIFGATNTDLFDDFKRLLVSRAEYESNGKDLWFATPLSEIDFSQCRKCTPSYRALPKDFPKPVFSERSELEAACLNDDWVSIPIGSEESNSFKHMRKNQYEEALFKCEDDQFEIDMIIDSNTCTIRVLEPIAEEIANLRVLEEAHANSQGTFPRFNFQLERRNLSTVHLNAITRIYGDHGAEILELLRKNPAGTVPIVLKRLKQKDLEWRKVRQDMSKGWKEIIEKNYEKSFDHRSFYFRQQDKRFYSARYLVAEIKSGAYEPGISADDMKAAGIMFAPLTLGPEYQNLYEGMNPQVAASYRSDMHGIHRDVHRVICHAMEASISNVQDKERISSFWRDLLRSFYNLSAYSLFNNSAFLSIPSTDKVFIDPSEAWQNGTKVITIFGSGKVISYRASDGCYQVQLPFGIGYLRPSVILGAEELSIQALSHINVYSDPVHGDSINGKPIVSSGSTIKENCSLFYGTQTCYLFFRLHHLLCTRLCAAKLLAMETIKMRSTETAAEHPMAKFDAVDEEGEVIAGLRSSRSPYESFIGQLTALLDGSIDNSRYEESCRQLLGNKAYIVFTFDKIISHTLKTLQGLVNDENVTKLIGLYVYHANRPGGADTEVYRNHAQLVLANSVEDLYRIQLITPSIADNTVMLIQYYGSAASADTSNNGAHHSQMNLPDAEEEDDDVNEGKDVDENVGDIAMIIEDQVKEI